MNASNQTGQRGFTLIELVVVIVILGILAAFAIPRFINISSEARASAVNGLAGSLRSTSALLHGMWLAQGTNPATLTLEGQTIDIVNGYPAATFTPAVATDGGIGDAMSTLDGFNNTVVGTAITFTPVSLPNPTAGCSVTYTEATGTSGATVVATVTNC